MKTYRDVSRCPSGHTFVAVRRTSSVGKVLATYCAQCEKNYRLLAGPIPKTRLRTPAAAVEYWIHTDRLVAEIIRVEAHKGGAIPRNISVHPTWEAAHAALVAIAHRHVEDARLALDVAQVLSQGIRRMAQP